MPILLLLLLLSLSACTTDVVTVIEPTISDDSDFVPVPKMLQIIDDAHGTDLVIHHAALVLVESPRCHPTKDNLVMIPRRGRGPGPNYLPADFAPHLPIEPTSSPASVNLVSLPIEKK